jgi:acylphosphatase
MSMMRITARAGGRVQGVGYSSFVTGCARETGVSGFVRNEPDGSVLIIAEGDGYALALFKRMLKAPGEPGGGGVLRVRDTVVIMYYCGRDPICVLQERPVLVSGTVRTGRAMAFHRTNL